MSRCTHTDAGRRCTLSVHAGFDVGHVYEEHHPQTPCEPPYHRPDCYGTNCDDEATRERCDPF